jgi:hypothetical protein
MWSSDSLPVQFAAPHCTIGAGREDQANDHAPHMVLALRCGKRSRLHVAGRFADEMEIAHDQRVFEEVGGGHAARSIRGAQPHTMSGPSARRFSPQPQHSGDLRSLQSTQTRWLFATMKLGFICMTPRVSA